MQYADSYSSKQLFDLVKSIGECRSKHEEDNIIMHELSTLQLKMQECSASTSKLREYIIRAIYIEMLGHDASFAHIYAIKMTNEKNALIKRIGYLACCIFFNRNNELLVLLVNTLQRDLSSRNQLDVVSALSSLPYLLNIEILSSIEDSIIKLLSHQTPIIRRKAYMVFIKVMELKPTIIEGNQDFLRRGLSDVDVSVVNSTLCIVNKINNFQPRLCLPLIPYMIANLKQIIENNVPKNYEYHSVPAPWIQIKILEIFSDLATFDKNVGNQVYEVIYNTIKKVELSVFMPSYNSKSMIYPLFNSNTRYTNNVCNISSAIFESCIKAVTSISTNRDLFNQLTETISKFLNSGINYLKYVGIKCLTRITKIDPTFAIPHQMVVVDCLEDKDETLRRCILDLLCKMTNPQNIEFVISKLIYNLISSKDSHFREELVKNILILSEKFSPTYIWYLNTMVKLFELSGETVGRDKANNIAQIIAEGPTGNESADIKFRTEASMLFSKILSESVETLPEILYNLAIWVIGEYGSINPNEACDKRSIEVVYETTKLLYNVFVKLKENLKVFQNNISICNRETEYDLSNVNIQTSLETISFIISAMMKCYSYSILVSEKISSPDNTEKGTYLNKLNDIYNSIISECLRYPCSLINQRNKEFIALILLNEEFKKENLNSADKRFFGLLNFILPYDASCEEICVDKTLKFLDGFVSEYKLSNDYVYKLNRNRNAVKKKKDRNNETICLIENLVDCNKISNSSTDPKFTCQRIENPDISVPEKIQSVTGACNTTKFENKLHDKGQSVNGKSFPTGSVISGLTMKSVLTSTNKWGPEGYKDNRNIGSVDNDEFVKIDNYEDVESKEALRKEFKKQEAIALFSGISKM